MLRLDALAPAHHGGQVLHIVHAFHFEGKHPDGYATFQPACIWGRRWALLEWEDVVHVDSDPEEMAAKVGDRRVCLRCMASARWRLNTLVNEFEALTSLPSRP